MTVSIAIGVLVGLLLAMTGAGGGILSVPLLVFFQHVEITEASAISLLAVGLSSAVGTAIGLRSRKVHVRAAVLAAIAGIAMSPLGISIAHSVDSRLLHSIFALTLFLVAIKAFYEAKFYIKDIGHSSSRFVCEVDNETGRLLWSLKFWLAMLTIGSITGFLSGLLGIGGGFVLVPALQRFTALGHQAIVATSLTTIALVATAGGSFNTIQRGYDLFVALPFIGGTVLGMLAGKAILSKISNMHTKLIFATMCILAACALLLKAF